MSLLFRIAPFVLLSIRGESMSPTLKPGQKVLVQKQWFFCKINTSEVIAFSHPLNGNLLIKRVKKIENGKYYVMGDNKQESTDSRDFGLISSSSIIGKVLFS